MHVCIHVCTCRFMDMNMGFVVAVIMNFIVPFVSQTILVSADVSHETSSNITKGECTAETGELRCCSMYYSLRGRCQECSSGTYRFLEDNDENCKECETGYYGRFCAFSCNCQIGNCDPVDGTCKCESGYVECNKEGYEAGKYPSHGPDRKKYVAIIVPVLLVLFLMLLVCTVSWIRLYKRFVSQDGENGRTRQLEDSTTISCLIYYINKIRVKLKPAGVTVAPAHHEEDGIDGHYCVIRESAMIRPLNPGHVSLYIEDGAEDDKYNHLNSKIERKITDVYLNNGNIYTKIQNIQSGKQTTVTLPNYDRMELNKDQH
ncbi:uncharacterized protein LOC127704120 [Mytilus californianus]|uniref:uncharacterized protein LOC127704120 n=1 Tax=Mytilus californianus TaxID=6549 RepID=UPI0022461F0D|nr:uncharacterized protein LOC127704120 [Mytilus californianus]